MTQPVVAACTTCKFWEAPSTQPEGREAPAPDYGRCHYSPPLVLLEMSAQTFWPRTLSTDWCGQYAAAA